jgi:glycosyltransferase involved in cell wall biosynthesis
MERVLFLINASEFGGLEIVLLDWLSGIDYSKVSVVLGCRGDALRGEVAARALPVAVVKLATQAGDTPWRDFRNLVRLLSSARPNRVVILEGNLGEFHVAAILAAWLASRRNVQLFVGGWGRSPAPKPASTRTRKLHYGFLPGIGLHLYLKRFEHWLRGKLLCRALVASEALRDNLLGQYGYPADRISIVYHGVDTSRFQPSSAERIEFRRANGIPDGARVIVSHGRLAPVKRVDRILKAFDVVSKEDTDLWLLLTAYGTYKEQVERLVTRAASNPRVKLVGFQQDASKILKASDIYVLASDNEGFGVALVEAMSSGLVCVATRCEGPAEIIVNGENGILVGATDEEVLAGLRRAVGLSQGARAKLVEQARRTVACRFEILGAVRGALDSMGIAGRRAG